MNSFAFEQLFIFLAVAVSTVLAYRGWFKTLRMQLPRWRSGTGVSSMLIVSVNWLFIIFLVVLFAFNGRWAQYWLDERLVTVLTCSAFAAALLALALRGVTRLLALAAGLLMALFYLSGWQI